MCLDRNHSLELIIEAYFYIIDTGVMSYSFSKFSGSRLQQGVCQCGLDIVNSKTYLHQGTLLDLAAANAQVSPGAQSL